nr:DUF4259 domain-containing protein [Streptomyces sp. Act143]
MRATLSRTIGAESYLPSPEGAEAVAAAALIAVQRPSGQPISTSPVAEKSSELAELWDGTSSGPAWRPCLSRLRAVLAPVSTPREEVVFDL